MMNNFLLKLGLDQINSASLKNQLLRIRRTLLISFAIAFAGIIGVYILSRIFEAPLSELTRDPSAVTDTKFYIGLLSNLGIMIWSATTTICFFGVSLLKYGKRYHQLTNFLLFSGILSLILTLDDAFLIHETVMPSYFHIPEKGVYLGYLIFSAGYLVYFFRRILSTDYLLLTTALLFLGLSIFIDKAFPFTDIETFIEDGFKFLGIVFWLAYFSRVALVTIYDSFTDK